MSMMEERLVLPNLANFLKRHPISHKHVIRPVRMLADSLHRYWYRHGSFAEGSGKGKGHTGAAGSVHLRTPVQGWPLTPLTPSGPTNTEIAEKRGENVQPGWHLTTWHSEMFHIRPKQKLKIGFRLLNRVMDTLLPKTKRES